MSAQNPWHGIGLSLAAILLATPVGAAEKPKLAIHVAKAITCAGDPIENATILVADGKIQAVGKRGEVVVPEGYQVIDHGTRWAMPGMIDAHSHIGGAMGDINEMVYQTNPELRVLDVIRPHNEQLKIAVAGGVTTITFIPGSGTNMGGWGALMKTGPGKLEDVLIRFPGVLKIAQAGNPERRGGEVGSGRMGMNHIIREQLREGMGYVKDWDDYEAGRRPDKPAVNLRLEYFKPLFRRQIPVLVHTQGYQVIMSTLRILHDEMNLKVIIGHGCFDSNLLSEEILKRGIPVMAGPRGFRYDPADGQVKGQVAGFADRGVKALGVNTDSPVVPQEELAFQATMAVRLGWNDEDAIRGLTIEPAKALMIADRVGSLEVGKDADIVITTGSILDPRHYVVEVFIDGRSVYDVKKDRRRF
ncbi:MAG: amidohydrolase family protein [Gemmatales bacterium]|nr:amidohydrolase family protein [Gemmatales bacterium]MDW8387763.1 amidohydrolase family protein [Gemmatales bacterium]